MEKPLAGGGCVERSKAICDVRALRCRLEPRRLTFPFAQFRRTDYALPRELCQASHSREESARNDPTCNMGALHYARTRGVAAFHVSSSPSHFSGALIGNRRACYARQATGENAHTHTHTHTHTHPRMHTHTHTHTNTNPLHSCLD
jgi:hypothetical protein